MLAANCRQHIAAAQYLPPSHWLRLRVTNSLLFVLY